MSTSKTPPLVDGSRTALLASIGDMVMTWNRTEGALKSLLLSLCDFSPASHALTAELGTTGLMHALKTLASRKSREIQEAVDHICKGFEILRVYRNYYAHGLFVCRIRDDQTYGIVYTISAKGEYAVDIDEVSVSDIANITQEMRRFSVAASELEDLIFPQAGSVYGQPLPSPETLPLPKKLQKTRSTPPLDQLRHPGSNK